MPYMLFPHTQIRGSDLTKITKRFGDLTICQPWYMETPVTDIKQTDIRGVHIQKPDTALKPRGDFNTLLSEYRFWVSQNRDKGYGNILGTTEEGKLTEDTPWEIRQLISRGGDNSDHQENLAFKWHLILHLAREFEESRVEAEKLLNRLKDQRSPLEGALEEAPPHRYFEDTPLMEPQLHVDTYRLQQIFEAWFGLFGDYVSDDIQLITLDPLVASHVSEIFEPEENTIRLENQVIKETPIGMLTLPGLSDGEMKIKDPVVRNLSGKTIILMEE